MRLASLTVLALVAIASALTGCGRRRRDPHAAAIETARARLTQLVASEQITTLEVAVGVAGKRVWRERLGRAGVEPLRLGSVSKLFTAMTLARLWQAKQVDLGAQIEQYVPKFPRHDGLTVERVAGHLGGVRHYDARDVFVPSLAKSIDAELATFAGDPLVAAPGTRYHYSSYGYVLLGAVIEGATGLSFEAALAREVLAPLGLSSIVLERSPEIGARWPGGGLSGRAEDVLALGMALAPSRGFVGADAVRVLLSPQRTTDGVETGVGLGWRVMTDPTLGRLAHHAGNMPRCRALLMVALDHDVAIAILSDRAGVPADIEALGIELLRRFVTK